MSIEAHEVIVAIVSVGQEDEVLRISPRRTRVALNITAGQRGPRAFLQLSIEQEAFSTTLLDGHAIHALHKLGTGGQVGQATGARVWARVDVSRNMTRAGHSSQGDHKGGEEELHRV